MSYSKGCHCVVVHYFEYFVDPSIELFTLERPLCCNSSNQIIVNVVVIIRRRKMHGVIVLHGHTTKY